MVWKAVAAPILGAAGVAVASMISRTKRLAPQTIAPTTEYNKRLVRKLYREVWNEQDLTKIAKAVHEIIGDDHIVVDPSQPHPDSGCHAYIDMVSNFRTAMPNFKIQIDMLVAEGSRVVAALSFSSGSVPNSSKQAKWTATAIFEFAGGQCVKTWVNSDSLSALIQFDLVPDVASGPFRRKNMKTGSSMLFPEEKMELVDALIGREEEHPQAVLTGKDWIEYFEIQVDKASQSDQDVIAEPSGSPKKKSLAKMRVDSKTGLDICV